MRSETFALRSLGYQIAAQIDRSDTTNDNALQARIALLTPIFKAFSTERANVMAGQVVQVFGGMGFIEETGVAQIMRDARITTIYEGTTGIQARDLLMRKVRGDQGLALKALLCEIDDQAAKVEANSALSKTAEEIRLVVVTIRSLLDKALLGQEEDSLLGVSVPFLDAMGTLCCAWQLMNAVVLADDDIDDGYYQNLIAMVQFYGAFRLPTAKAALQTVESKSLGLQEYVF
jgi:acyl-CoA dehydrogenase